MTPYRIAALTLAGALLASAPAVRAQAPAPFAIEVVTSLTGSAAFVGQGVQRTLGILEGVVNRAGGIRGVPVHFVLHDDQSSPQVAVQLYNELIDRHVPLVLGPNAVATCGAVQPLIKTSIVEYCLSPAMYPLPGSYGYSSGMSAHDIVAVAIRYFRERGWRRIALITSTDATGADFERSYDGAAALPENRSVTRVLTERFNPTDVTVSAQMSRIKQANPDGIFAFSLGTPFGTVLRAYTDAGLTLPLMTSTGNMSLAQMAQYGQFDTRNLYVVGFRFFDRARIGRGPLKDAIESFTRAFVAAGVKPEAQPGFSWDVGLLAVAAFRAAGLHATPAQIKAFIDGQHSFIGIDGIYDFPGVPQRGLNDLAAVMTRWDPAQSYWVVVSRPGGLPR